jgi:hypothetical protein
MPYLQCPACHRTAWLRGEPGRDLTCRRCDTALGPLPDRDVRYLTRAVRERFARDARLNAGRPRFLRERR